MKQRRGPLGRAAEGMAAAARRRQQERAPRVIVYDVAGHSRLLASDADGYFELLETCGLLIGLAEEAELSARSGPGSEPGAAPEGDGAVTDDRGMRAE